MLCIFIYFLFSPHTQVLTRYLLIVCCPLGFVFNLYFDYDGIISENFKKRVKLHWGILDASGNFDFSMCHYFHMQYDMKLLAVDVPMASGPDQRLFLIGNEEEYRVGGGLISELRDPVLKAMAATKEFDDLDEIEEEEDAERERLEAERKNREEIEKMERVGT